MCTSNSAMMGPFINVNQIQDQALVSLWQPVCSPLDEVRSDLRPRLHYIWEQLKKKALILAKKALSEFFNLVIFQAYAFWISGTFKPCVLMLFV